jgi:hypothetical protein
MMPSRIRRRSVWLGFTVLLGATILLASAATVPAQVLSDPRIAEFDPSPDHWAVVDGGQPAVLRYELDLYVVGASAPFGTLDMGKPAPQGDGKIRYDFAAQIAALSLPGGNYEARVSAVGPQGEALSAPSNPFTFTSPFSCTVYLGATAVQAAAGGGGYAVTVTTGADCTWTVTNTLPWVTVWTAGGTGNGTFSFDVAANTSLSGRSGTITIGDSSLTVTQPGATPPCTYGLSPASYSAVAGGASTSFSVTAGSTCAWTAAPSAGWITVTSGGSGTGNGTVAITLAANTATTSRTGTVTVQGQTFTITQAAAPPPCTYSLSPASYSAVAGGASTSFSVTAGSTCAWTATPSAGWITVTSGGSGTGNGTVAITVAANTATTSRTGTVTVQGQTFTITQAAAPAPECSYGVTPTSFNMGVFGGARQVVVTTDTGCSWTATPSHGWLVPAVTSGTGSATVAFTVRANNATSSRTGRLTIGPWVVTVTQEGKPRRVK